MGGFIHGILLGELFKNHSLHEVNQNSTDGATARYYSESDWRNLVNDLFAVKTISVIGMKAEMFPIPAGRFKNGVMNMVPSSITRFLLNSCSLGAFLVIKMKKL